MRQEGRSGIVAMRRDAASEPGTVRPSSRPAAGPSLNVRVERLYDRHKHQVFHLALRYGRGNASWAEDVAQEVFLELFEVLDRLVDEDELAGWFYRVTTNRCLNKLKRERFMSSPLVQLFLGRHRAELVDPEKIALARADLSAAFRAVAALPPKENIAFFMRYVDDKDLDDVARVLGHSKGYVSKLLDRARRRLGEAGWKVDDDGR
jgi:RNA polymerase sigma-70 factor (ECF subfamily)